MKAGKFNIHEYLEKLNESLEDSGNIPKSEGDVEEHDGILIPSANKKSYDWLKKEYNANQTEVKVEIVKGGAKFEPDENIQASNDSDKNLKPGMFGNDKSSDTKEEKNLDNLEDKKNTPEFTEDESKSKKEDTSKEEKPKKEEDVEKKTDFDKTKEEKENINKEDTKKENKEEPHIKKVDLKTKRND